MEAGVVAKLATDADRIPTVEDFISTYDFTIPLLCGLQRVIQRDLPTALKAAFSNLSRGLYANEKAFAAEPDFDKVELLLGENYHAKPPYLILSADEWGFESYEGKLLTIRYAFSLLTVTGAPQNDEAVITAERITGAAVRVLLRAQPRDYWVTQGPKAGLDSTITIKSVKKMPQAVDGTKPIEQRKINFHILTRENGVKR